MNIIGYFTTPIKVIEGDLSCMQDISSYALDVKDLLNEKVSPELSDKATRLIPRLRCATSGLATKRVLPPRDLPDC